MQQRADVAAQQALVVRGVAIQVPAALRPLAVHYNRGEVAALLGHESDRLSLLSGRRAPGIGRGP
eukprot:6309222-Pyramimonas_sp.AAC.1